MVNPTPEVWGAPDSWIDTPSLPTTGANHFLKCGNAKSANFGDNLSTLDKGNTEGKTLINHDIDPTICPCGQDPAVSCFGKRDYYINLGEGADPHLVRTVTESDPINWFLFSGSGAGTGVPDYNGGDYDNDNARWAPDAVIENNMNRLVAPVVYWEYKSILLRIEVQCITNDSYTNYPSQLTWRTLDTWKNSYSNQKIVEVRFWFETTNSSNANTITYRNHTSSSTGGLHGIGLLSNHVDALNVRDITDYCAYQRKQYSCIDIIGSWLHGNYNRTDRTYIIMHKDAEKFPNIDDKSYVTPNTDRGFLYWYEIPYSDTTYESIMKMAACFGCPFTPTGAISVSINYLSEDICLPIIDEAGITHGEYTRGSGNINNDMYDAESIRDKNYDPKIPVDDNIYSSQTYFNPVLNLSSMCKRYVLNDAAVEQLCRDLWKISDDLIHTDPNEDFKDYDQLMLDNFLVNSPIDVIVSLDKYPISDIPTGTNSEPIKYGKASGAALGKPLTVNTIFFNFAGVHIFPKFGRSFLDYSPYTTYELYIPFCGVIQIDAGDIMDHTLSVQMVMDLSTGAVTAYVMADNLCIETANGSAALNIPVSGIDSITLNSQINNALISAKSAQMQARSTGTLTGRIGGGLKSVKESLNPKTATMQKATDTWAANLADYELTHQQLNPHKIGSASAACSWSLELTCRLMIYYPEGDAIDSSGGVSRTSPKLADLTLYGHTTGFSCISSGAVSNYHGFTVGNIDTSSISGATEQERDMIKSLFARGVYLP